MSLSLFRIIRHPITPFPQKYISDDDGMSLLGGNSPHKGDRARSPLPPPHLHPPTPRLHPGRFFFFIMRALGSRNGDQMWSKALVYRMDSKYVCS